MTVLTAAQLHDLLSPLWEREPELRPEGLRWRLSQWHCFRSGRYSFWIDTVAAAQLCESQMLRWLGKQGHVKVFGGVGGWEVDLGDEWPFGSDTLIEALTSACTAALDAKAHTEPAG